jgi:hypothetical protein
VPIVTQQFATLTSASVTFSGLAAVEKGRMLATGKNSLDFHFTVCVFRKLPAFDFTLIKEKKRYVNLTQDRFNAFNSNIRTSWPQGSFFTTSTRHFPHSS